MAREKRSESLLAMIPEMTANKPKGRGKSVTQRLTEVLAEALPVYEASVLARAAYAKVRTSIDKAVAQAAAIFALDVTESVLPRFAPKGSNVKPATVWSDAYKAQFSIVAGALVSQRIGKNATDKEREAAEKLVGGLRAPWSRASLVMFHASPKVLAEYAKGSYPVPLQQAYTKARAAASDGKVSPARLERIAEQLNALNPEQRRAVLAMVKGVTLPAIKESPSRKGKQRQTA